MVGDKEEAGSREPATFRGRLQLDDFKYSAAEALPRRNPRRSAASSAVASPISDSAIATVDSTQSSPRGGSTSRNRSSTPSSPAKGRKRKRPSSGYAPPATYAHLPLLPDAITPNLLVLFVGLNPGIQTARSGHAYAHPSNLFWKLLFSSGVTPRLCRPDEDRQMPALYSLGHTNIVARPSRNGAELSRSEMDDGVALLEEKARTWRPESMCIVGKSIWESIWRVRHSGRPVGKAFRYGWQDDEENMGVVEGQWPGARVFVASSTSGLAATLSPAEKQKIWDELGAWVKVRRAEREIQADKEAEVDENHKQEQES